MKSSSSGSDTAAAVANAFQGSTNRKYRWVTDKNRKPSSKSARGALDGENYSSKGNTFATTVLAETMKVGQEAEGSTFGVYKAFLSFDTPVLPDDAQNVTVELVLYGKKAVIDRGGRDFHIKVFKSVYLEPLWNPDWEAIIGPPQETEASRTNVSTHDYPSDPNASPLTIDPDTCRFPIQIKDPSSLIEWGGVTKVALVSSLTYASDTPHGSEYVVLYSPTVARKELRPELIIKYSGSATQIKPVLSWIPGNTYFRGGGANPDQLNSGQNTVEFRVRYISADTSGGTGALPSVHQVAIDLNANGTYDTGEYITMDEVDPTDQDCSDGKDYKAVVNIASNGVNIRFQFLFKVGTTDVEGNATGVQWLTAIQASKDSDSSNNLCFISSIQRGK